MNISDYQARCSSIHRELASIAERTKVMAAANCANPSNPDWAPIMDRQDALLAELKSLDSQPLTQ